VAPSLPRKREVKGVIAQLGSKKKMFDPVIASQKNNGKEKEIERGGNET